MTTDPLSERKIVYLKDDPIKHKVKPAENRSGRIQISSAIFVVPFVVFGFFVFGILLGMNTAGSPKTDQQATAVAASVRMTLEMYPIPQMTEIASLWDGFLAQAAATPEPSWALGTPSPLSSLSSTVALAGVHLESGFDADGELNTSVWNYSPTSWARRDSSLTAIRDYAWLLTRSVAYQDYFFLVEFTPVRSGSYMFVLRDPAEMDAYSQISLILFYENGTITGSSYYFTAFDTETNDFRLRRPVQQGTIRNLDIPLGEDGRFQINIHVHDQQAVVMVEGRPLNALQFPPFPDNGVIGMQFMEGAQIHRMLVGSY